MSVMGIANELVDDIRRERNWSTEQLAAQCGYSRTQTNYFCNGQATPPAEFLGSLFEATLDPRLPNLNTGRLTVGFVIHKTHALRDLGDQATLNRLIEDRRQQIDAELAILELLKDGLTPGDPQERGRYDRALREIDESVTSLFDLKQALVAGWKKASAEHAGKDGRGPHCPCPPGDRR